MAETAFKEALELYYGRNGKKRDFTLAAQKFQEAAKLGVGRAALYLMLLENGDGPSLEQKLSWDPDSRSLFERHDESLNPVGKCGASTAGGCPLSPCPPKSTPSPCLDDSMTAPATRGFASKRVCVIGAGMSGLACARHLLNEGHEVHVFEQAEQLGGNWVYRRHRRGRSTHSSCYENLCTNTFRDSTSYSDFPMPADYPSNPHNSQLLRYFQSYADCFGLHDVIELNTTVVFIDKHRAESEEPIWRVFTKHSPATLEDDSTSSIRASRPAPSNERGCAVISLEDANVMVATGTTREWQFDAVAVCTGHHWDPIEPANVTGVKSFEGQMIHSHDYRSPSEFRGQRVVVAGMGISGNDIAKDLDGHAALVMMSTHRFDPSWAASGGGAEAAAKGLAKDGVLGRLFKAFTKHGKEADIGTVPTEDRKKIGNYELW